MSQATLHMIWPADGQDAWWDAADRFACGHVAREAWRTAAQQATQKALLPWLDSMHGLGWASLCASPQRGGHGQSMAVLCRVLEALAAVNASAAAAVYASAAAHLVLNACALPAERQALMRDMSVDWLAWPAFHDIDEQLWPTVDAQGYLRGQVDMMLCGAHARWAVLPAQLRDQGMALVSVDLAHPAVIRRMPLQTLGLATGGINDVEFGGVPCEVLSTQGRQVFEAVNAHLALAVMAMSCGVSRGGLEAAQAHAQTRQQGGGTLLGWGEVRRLVSLMQERLRVMHGLLLAGLTGGVPAALNARYAALHVGDLACALTSDGVQLLGGIGYMNTNSQAQRLCDARQIKGLMGGVAWRRQGLLNQALDAGRAST